MADPTAKFPNIYDYILSEETNYRTHRVPLASNYDFNMWEHIDKSFQLKNSQFTIGNNDYLRPFNNIIIPIANVNYRTEGFDVKDVEVFVNDKDNYYKSLLTRKFHNRWAKKYSIDTAIDQSVESYFDYGLILVKNLNDKRPEIVPLQKIAFCDQTDILSGPICLKHQYSLDELQEMKGKWNSEMIDQVIRMARFSQLVNEKEAKTPGKYIEIYELHGVFPTGWLKDNYLGDTGSYSPQFHAVTYYIDQTSRAKNGISLFKGKEAQTIFKALKRDDIQGRACGRGGIEELFHPQIWTNFSEIHLAEMLQATSKVVLQTADKKLAKNNNLKNLKQGQIVTHEEGKPLTQAVIQPFNKTHFDNFVNKWEQVARTIGSASDPQLGLNPVSGTPLGTTQIVTAQGQGIHEYRRGKIATFWGEIYRDWVLNYLKRDMLKGDEWIEELSLDELKEVAEKVTAGLVNKRIKEIVLSGRMITKAEEETMRTIVKETFLKGGKKRFLKLVENELKDLPLDVEFNIAGKQKNLAEMVGKLNNVFRAIFSNPAILQQEGMAELFNQILESSGLSPINFMTLTKPAEVEPELSTTNLPIVKEPVGV